MAKRTLREISRDSWTYISSNALTATVVGGLILTLVLAGGKAVMKVGGVEAIPSTQPKPSSTSRTSTAPTPAAKKSGQPRPAPPILPPLPSPTSADQVPEVSGDLLAVNKTVDKDGRPSDWIEAAPLDDIEATLTVTNRGKLTLSGLVLEIRTYMPQYGSKLLALFVTVRRAADQVPTMVPGTQMTMQWPDDGGCGFTESYANLAANPYVVVRPAVDVALVQSSPATDSPVSPATGWVSSNTQERVAVVAQYALPELNPGSAVRLRGPVTVEDADDLPQISGGPLEFKVVGDTHYVGSGGATIGDVVRVLVFLHNPSCSTRNASATLRATVSEYSKRGFLKVGAVVEGKKWFLNPEKTEFEPVTINIEGRMPATLQPIRGTTKVFAATCADPEQLVSPPDADYLFQGGISVSVPGYIPRMQCDGDIRWVSTDLLVVEAS